MIEDLDQEFELGLGANNSSGRNGTRGKANSD
jgi:hypothetical protein